MALTKINELITQHQQEWPEPGSKSDGERPKIGKELYQAIKEESSTCNPEITGRLVELLWLRMTKIFGTKWSGCYGLTDDGTWQAALGHLSKEEITAGIVACLKWDGEWPPTLPQFLRLCKSRQTRGPVTKALPEPKESRDIRKREGMEQIRRLRAIIREIEIETRKTQQPMITTKELETC